MVMTEHLREKKNTGSRTNVQVGQEKCQEKGQEKCQETPRKVPRKVSGTMPGKVPGEVQSVGYISMLQCPSSQGAKRCIKAPHCMQGHIVTRCRVHLNVAMP
jgi:hypothetical protein